MPARTVSTIASRLRRSVTTTSAAWQSEADHLPGDRPAQRWAVAAGGGGDLDRWKSRRLQPGGRPWLEAAGVAAEPPGAGDGGEDGAGRGEQGAAGGVEVVAVVVVAEQHRVDQSQVGGGDRRPGQLP
jgi:hypothetical protein